MCIKMVALVLAARIEPASHKLALVQLAEGTNTRTGVVWRSMASIAACVGVSERQAKRIVRDLREQHLLRVVANGTGGAPGTVPVYSINAQGLHELSTDFSQRGVADVTPTPGDGCHAGLEGCHPGSERGDAHVTQTGIGTIREPASVASAPVDSAEARPQKANSRFPEKDSLSADRRAQLARVVQGIKARPRPVLRAVR